ncbi:MAG: 4Fe-4S binding protein [Eggerthellaceae bacterium]|nr:4Fe-4S binding protein [Eggerthellaceae bacterium]
MGSFKLGGMTFGSLFKKPETLLYPFEKKEPPKGLKGHIVNETDKCILCAICQRACPCNAITVEKKERIWSINPFLCVQCGSCVRACPKSCLEMQTSYTEPTTAKYCIVDNVPDPKAQKKEQEAASTAK